MIQYRYSAPGFKRSRDPLLPLTVVLPHPRDLAVLAVDELEAPLGGQEEVETQEINEDSRTVQRRARHEVCSMILSPSRGGGTDMNQTVRITN